MTQVRRLSFLTPLFLLALALPVLAHPGHGTRDFAGGFTHPFSGTDHLLAMIAVGLFAAQRGGRAIFLLPLSFVGCMILGGLLAFTPIHLPSPMIEYGIDTSVLILGLLLASSAKLPTWLGMTLCGLFALCHGYAHTTEMPVGASLLTYAIGFILATSILHLTGIALAKLPMKSYKPVILRTAGLAIAVCGILIFLDIIKV